MKLCIPLVIYLILSGIGLSVQLYHALTGESYHLRVRGMPVSKNHITIGGFLIDLVFTAIVACFLNFLCMKGYVGVAWAFIILKLFFSILVILLVFSLVMNLKQHHMRHHRRERMADYPGAMGHMVNPESIPRNVIVDDRGVKYSQIQEPSGRTESIGQAMFDLQMSGR